MSRPKAITPEIAIEICERIADGETVRQIAASEGMPSARTIYLTLSNDEQFSQQYARAREAQLSRWEDEMLEIADDGTNDWVLRQGSDEDCPSLVANHDHISRSKVRIDTRKWLMSKRMPKKYGDKLALDGDGHGGPIQHSLEVRFVGTSNRVP